MLLQHLRTPLALAFVLLGPLSVFAQRHTSAPVPVGFPSTAVAGSTFRALIGPPVVNVSNIPMRGSIPANFPTNNLSQVSKRRVSAIFSDRPRCLSPDGRRRR